MRGGVYMTKRQLTAKAVKSQVPPFTPLIAPVRNTLTNEPYAFRSVRRVNSLTLGTLRPLEYRVVSDRTQQSVKMAKGDLLSAAAISKRLDEKHIEHKWVSVHLPLKLALRKDAMKIIEQSIKESGASNPGKICLELPSDALYEDMTIISATLKDLKLLGLTTALSSFGGEYCPITKLFGLPVDVCLFDYTAAKSFLADKGRLASSLAAFVASNGGESVICVNSGDTKNQIDEKLFFASGFVGYTSWEWGEEGWFEEDKLDAEVFGGE